jgi:hypothetical protein
MFGIGRSRENLQVTAAKGKRTEAPSPRLDWQLTEYTVEDPKTSSENNPSESFSGYARNAIGMACQPPSPSKAHKSCLLHLASIMLWQQPEATS